MLIENKILLDISKAIVEEFGNCFQDSGFPVK